MTSIAGHLSKIVISDDGGATWINLGGIIDMTLNLNIDELETTTHDSGGARSYIPNHHDATVDGTLRWDEDDLGQASVLEAVFDKTSFLVQLTMQTQLGKKRFDASAFATNCSPGGPLDDTAGLALTLRLSNLLPTLQVA